MAQMTPTAITGAMSDVADILCPLCHKPNLRRAKRCQHCGGDIMLNNDGPRRYKITSVIKQGGQGAVYRGIGVDAAGQQTTTKQFAVKEMLDRFTDPKERAEAVDRFDSEAELLQHLTHSRIPRVYDHFKDEGRSYLVMDFIQGEDMEQVLQREGAQPEARVLQLAEQLCDVLDYLHRKGFIYRDMKPSNIMIDQEQGGIKLVDFGIAKLFQPSQRGTQIGTPGYAPPEQYQGMAIPESDIYALGATLHHMLTGRDPRDEQPFSFPPVQQLKPEVSRRTADAIAKALQWKADDRYPSVADFWSDLRPMSTPTQRQVRVAPETQVLPPQASVATAPAAVPATVPARPATVAPAQPSVPAVKPASSPATKPASPSTVQPAKPRVGFLTRVRRFLTRLFVSLIAVLILGAVLVWQFPWVVQPYAGTINQYLPGLIPTATATPLLSSQQLQREVEVTVAEGSDDATIRQALRDAYVAVIQQEFGSQTAVNRNTLSTVGAYQQVGDATNGQVLYRATMTAFVAVP